MHNQNLDLSIEEITKIEGTASVDIKIRDGVLTQCHFGIVEMQRFFQEAVRGKSITSLPHLLARICGTCSNAHLLASIASVEHGLQITVSEQTTLLRKLLNYGLMIRDHGLHLYVFVLPDLYHRESILAFDEANDEEHALVHDCFAVKEVGNKLSVLSGGRAVHAPLLAVGGFNEIPSKESLLALIPELEQIRPRVLRLIEVFEKCSFSLIQDLKFLALSNADFSFLDGEVVSSDGVHIPPDAFESHLNPTDIPYSQATGYLFDGHVHFVGALSRINLNKDALHAHTKRDAQKALSLFPSNNIYHNNLAQAIEMLHSVDASIDLIQKYLEIKETPAPVTLKESIGIGIIEAPRGTLFHKVEMTDDGKVKKSKVIVPTGQNQIGIEVAIRDWVSKHTELTKEELELEIQKIIRAYDPCMSCATHFLKLKIEN
jgi:coenzyme F420-reducing hydrogenase alpha subunit